MFPKEIIENLSGKKIRKIRKSGITDYVTRA
jgi:hypothetical protein